MYRAPFFEGGGSESSSRHDLLVVRFAFCLGKGRWTVSVHLIETLVLKCRK